MEGCILYFSTQPDAKSSKKFISILSLIPEFSKTLRVKDVSKLDKVEGIKYLPAIDDPKVNHPIEGENAFEWLYQKLEELDKKTTVQLKKQRIQTAKSTIQKLFQGEPSPNKTPEPSPTKRTPKKKQEEEDQYYSRGKLQKSERKFSAEENKRNSNFDKSRQIEEVKHKLKLQGIDPASLPTSKYTRASTKKVPPLSNDQVNKLETLRLQQLEKFASTNPEGLIQ